MTPAEQRQLEDLVSGRWDPRRGIGPRLGRVRWVLIWLFVGFILWGRYIPGSLVGLPQSGLFSFAYLVPGAGLLACWLLPISIRARTRRRYAAHAGLLCPWCRYPVAGLAERGLCPECGSGFRADACRTLYDNAYRAFQPDPSILKQRERQAWKQALEARTGRSEDGGCGVVGREPQQPGSS